LKIKESKNGNPKPGHPCSGDSGGPLIWKRGNEFVQFGVASKVVINEQM